MRKKTLLQKCEESVTDRSFSHIASFNPKNLSFLFYRWVFLCPSLTEVNYKFGDFNARVTLAIMPHVGKCKIAFRTMKFKGIYFSFFRTSFSHTLLNKADFKHISHFTQVRVISSVYPILYFGVGELHLLVESLGKRKKWHINLVG